MNSLQKLKFVALIGSLFSIPIIFELVSKSEYRFVIALAIFSVEWITIRHYLKRIVNWIEGQSEIK